MSDALTQIWATTRAAVARAKEARPPASVERAAAAAAKPRGFVAALERRVAAGGYGLIAEIKKASPSAGLIRADFDPPALARAYARGGAACLSVLTEEAHFQGALRHLDDARKAVDLPLLRKDFMLDPYQVPEARAAGADCILLILAGLDDIEARGLEKAAIAWGLDVLAEVHNIDELRRALHLKTRLIGINNRDLKTLKTDLATTEKLVSAVPGDRILVCESGLATPGDLRRMANVGVRCFLVGEALMRQPDVEAATRALLAIHEPART
ncbi:MAG TPA: indole-3-glycerol phosphate synthase TrpC [Stellaceae bacterium]|nr:indole-3-glycerol phosphate synthase TrpC [Stellaceae bacterium]